MKIFITIILLTGFLFSAFFSPVHALKKRIRAPKIAGVNYAKVVLSRNTHSAIVTFQWYANVKRYDYVLSYTTNGRPQGVVGSFVANGQNTSRDLYFGTCSHGVCTPHYGITGATLTVTTTLTNGATYIKRFVFKNV